jgi:hypothetical protein
LAQSNGEHDFDLQHPDGHVSALEVTSSIDRTLEETHDAIINKGGPAIEADVCKNSWHIFPSRNARINRLRKEIDNYLAAIELAGIEKFWGPTDCRPSVEAIYADLGVVSGSVVSWIKPGHILMALPGTCGAFGAISVIEAAEREAFKADNRKKLGAAAGAERHLAIYVRAASRPWVGRLDFEPPPDVPHLPPEVTNIWVFSEAHSEHKYVVWRASASWPWEKLELTLDILE